MPDLELTRSREERDLYELSGVGSLRLRGWLTKSASAQTGERGYEFAKRGLFSPTIEATDAAGTAVGGFKGRTIKRGGTLTWHGKDYTLRPAAAFFKERYALADADDRELATLEGKGWGKRPVKISTVDVAALDPGLLLFAAFVVRGLADDASAAAGGAAAASTGAVSS